MNFTIYSVSLLHKGFQCQISTIGFLTAKPAVQMENAISVRAIKNSPQIRMHALVNIYTIMSKHSHSFIHQLLYMICYFAGNKQQAIHQSYTTIKCTFQHSYRTTTRQKTINYNDTISI